MPAAATRRRLGQGAILGLAMLLTACAAPPKTLYQWGGYQAALYAYLRGSATDLGAQAAQLEAQAQRSAAEGASPPPGLHGHLALLYSKSGDDANAVRHLQIEKRLFPESAAFINHLLKNAARATTPP
jgi:hypothetical protein